MAELAQLEFLRAGIGLVPAAGGGADAAIFIATVPGSRQPLRSCTCATARRRSCEHLQDLGEALGALERRRPRLAWDDWFTATLWHRLARLLQESDPQPCDTVRVRRLPGGELQLTSAAGEELACWLDGGSPAALRLLERTGKVAGAGLTAATPATAETTTAESAPRLPFDRAGLLDRLAMFQLAPHERDLAKRGFKTQRQTWEESFWYRLAYHCVRETQGVGGGTAEARAAGTFHPAVEGASGRFTLAFRPSGAGNGAAPPEPLVRLTVPRGQVEAVLRLLAAAFPDQADLAISPVPLRSILHVSAETRFDRPEIEVRPAIQAIQAGGEARYFAPDERFRYGNLVYLPELGVLAALERAGQERRFRAPAHLKLTGSQVPAFLASQGEAVAAGYLVLDEPLRGQRVWKHFDSLAVSGGLEQALERAWTWLGVHYGFGNQTVSLADLLQARREGLPYLETSFGWIDLGAPAFEHLGRLVGGGAAPRREAGAEGGGAEGGEGGTGANGGEAGDGANGIEGAAGAEGSGATAGEAGDGGSPRLTLLELLRIQAAAGLPTEARGAGAGELARLLDLRPAMSVGQPAGLRSALRRYQEAGADWLRFLVENRLGGLLCDDMGLGKTHQVMALLVSLLERRDGAAPASAPVLAPFLVVCPTSVASHWRNKLRDHAPGLSVHLHHGSQRSLPRRLAAGSVVITSYGVLRRDGAELARRHFAVAVFDEAQHLKNPGTQAYRAAAGLDAGVRLGLTGTPIENSLADLKALFDLVLPGYLGSDADFSRRYLRSPRGGGGVGSGGGGGGGGLGLHAAAESGQGSLVGVTRDEAGGRPDPEAMAGLRRLIAPFVLRRSKGAVLAELPEKIEDLRTCALSDDQVALYRDAIAGRGADLARELAEASGPLPYIHVFALLNLLKQICDHPALALNRLDDADRYASGKWDLYREVIEECLGSGLKVVVFTQYLGMIRLMERHLATLGVEHVTLTGGSGGALRRGGIVDRFNDDPACRVFLGSLKAGGTGIDLVGGSVVIHYDRWWNAAREDQATDRVHRIGQRRAVQVLKLITEGTLEEKIAAIIERKRGLLGDVVAEDDPTLAKAFSRDELLDLLRWPGAGGQGEGAGA